MRWWAIITLGRFFTVDVTIEKNHELVERGPFHLVRHPSYTGVLLAFVGLALSLRNWAALLVILVPIGVAFIHRMNVEEEGAFGGPRPALRGVSEADQATCALRLFGWVRQVLLAKISRGAGISRS